MPTAGAQSFTRLVDEEAIDGELFGTYLAFRGDELWLGAPYRLIDTEYTGAVLIFEQDEQGDWYQSGSLTPADTNAVTQFGQIFQVFGDEAIIGGLSGDVSVFKLIDGQWWAHQTLIKFNPSGPYDYWTGIQVVGKHAFIGARGKERYQNSVAHNGGSVFVFEKTGDSWTHISNISASQPIDGFDGEFGWPICASEDILAIGAHRDVERGESAGSAYVYKLEAGQWIERQKLVGSDTEAHDQFGRLMTCSADELILHAYSGASTYQFNREADAWVEGINKITIPGDSSAGHFFEAVNIQGDLLLLSGSGNGLGGVHLYYRQMDQWTYFDEITSPDIYGDGGTGLQDGGFGEKAIINDRYLVVSAPYRRNEETGAKAGAVFVFDREALAIPTSIARWPQNAEVIINKAYPNPFSSTATVSTFLERKSFMQIAVYNVIGQQVDIIMQGELPSGTHQFEWTPVTQTAGIYFLRLTSSDQVQVRPMIYNP